MRHQIHYIPGELVRSGMPKVRHVRPGPARSPGPLERRGIGWFYWDLCSEFGLYNCEKGKWDKDLLDILLP